MKPSLFISVLFWVKACCKVSLLTGMDNKGNEIVLSWKWKHCVLGARGKKSL